MKIETIGKHPDVDAMQIAIDGETYIQCAGILRATFPDDPHRNGLTTAYRDLHPDNIRLLARGTVQPFGYYVKASALAHFGDFIIDPANRRYAQARGQMIGQSVKLAKTKDAIKTLEERIDREIMVFGGLVAKIVEAVRAQADATLALNAKIDALEALMTGKSVARFTSPPAASAPAPVALVVDNTDPVTPPKAANVNHPKTEWMTYAQLAKRLNTTYKYAYFLASRQKLPRRRNPENRRYEVEVPVVFFGPRSRSVTKAA